MIAKMNQALIELADNHLVKVLVVNSSGKTFSAGADVSWMQKMAHYDHAQNFRDAKALGKLMYQLYHFNKPTIAKVQGHAYGGGVGLIACCNIAITADSARFCFSEVKLGLIPAVISPYIINAIGTRFARAYFLSANTFDAKLAQQMGLCHEVVPLAALDNATISMINQLLQNGPKALLAVNSLMNELQSIPITENLANMTAEKIARLRVSAEGQEGLSAFLEKREPSWAIKP
jgi:methylglutaconyl-CoA hydratase